MKDLLKNQRLKLAIIKKKTSTNRVFKKLMCLLSIAQKLGRNYNPVRQSSVGYCLVQVQNQKKQKLILQNHYL